MPLGNHEDPAPNLHLWKKHDSDLPMKEPVQGFLKLRKVAPKSPREPRAASPFRFCARSQRGSVASLLERRAGTAALRACSPWEQFPLQDSSNP